MAVVRISDLAAATTPLDGTEILEVEQAGSSKKVTAQDIADLSGGGFSNPMTTSGDIITGGASGAPQRLGIGASGQVLTVVSGSPAWAAPSGTSVPVQEEGVTVVSSPTAINFVGAGVTATNVGGVATVTIPGGGGGGGAWDGTAFLAADFEMAGTSVQLMPNLRFTPDASSLYEIELMALVRSGAVTTAPQVSIRTNPAASIGGVSIVGQNDNSTAVFSFQTASGADARAAAITAAGPDGSAQLVIGRALFRTNSGPSEVRIGLQASNSAATVTMITDSMLRWKKLA